MCGLKLTAASGTTQPDVTPFVGVWIETQAYTYRTSVRSVTPFVGVWIETVGTTPYDRLSFVTPFVGVWIETHYLTYN